MSDAPPPANPSRQARRKMLRDETKALRRQSVSGAPAAAPSPASEAPVSPGPPSPAIAANRNDAAPLPRDRSLVAARPRGIALFAQRLLVTIGLRRPVPATQRPIGQQLRALREELAALQRSLDRMIEGASAN